METFVNLEAGKKELRTYRFFFLQPSFCSFQQASTGLNSSKGKAKDRLLISWTPKCPGHMQISFFEPSRCVHSN